MNTSHITSLLNSYVVHATAQQKAQAQTMLDLIEKKPTTCTNRKEFDPGHICASAWIVNPEHTHALLAHHKSLNKLMQLGGHIEPTDETLYGSVHREVVEETGLEPRSISQNIYDIDIHTVPERPQKSEPAHQHFDIRFLVEVPFEKPNPPAEESQQIDWYPIESITNDLCESSVTQMTIKTSHI